MVDEEVKTPVEEDKRSDLEKINDRNAEMEKALIKGRELKAEQQKQEAEGLMGGEAGGHIEVKTVSPEDKKKAQAEEFFKGTALGDAIKKTND